MYILGSILGSMAALVLAGILYQRVGASRDRLRYTVAGRWVDIGHGCSLYLLEKGPDESGGPTVLFESGIAATNLNWSRIQETVSKFAHTASYDRGGLGWSSPASTTRTPGNIATELHAMLESAGIKPPYVLVGHSFGGLVVRRFALLYPEDVAGIVLVDPMRCEEWPPLDPTKRGYSRSRFPIDRLCDSHRWLRPRSSRCDVPAVPLWSSLRLFSRRRRRWRQACAWPHQGRSR